MKTLNIIPVLLFSLLLGAPSYSADFNKGLTAYNNGDYATALKEWTPLAEQGVAEAQYNLGVMYQEGAGVPQDYKEVLHTLAAKQELQKHSIIWEQCTTTEMEFSKTIKKHYDCTHLPKQICRSTVFRSDVSRRSSCSPRL